MQKLGFLTANEYFHKKFGGKVYRISLNGGMSCPNRDGRSGTGGCIFCSKGGSGDFAGKADQSIKEQIASGKELLKNKIKNCNKFIAYFQAFTNTYAPMEYLREIFTEAINEPEIVALSIATRPDCLGDECLSLLSELNKIKPVWVELGLQTISEKTAEFIRRGFDLKCYDEAVEALKKEGIEIITHIILGLPKEDEAMMLDTVKYVCSGGINGIKLQLLQVLKGTDLADIYHKNPFHIMSMEEYGDLLIKALSLVPNETVVHRITGDPPKNLLIEPKWAADKKRVFNYLNGRIARELAF